MNNPFDKIDYKFGTEGILSMYMDTYQLILGADLESYSKQKNETFNDNNPCHIYFILKRPKVTINPDSFKSRGKKVKFDFIIHHQDGYGIVHLNAEFLEAKSKLELITEYPYNLFAIMEKEKTHIFARPSTLIDSNGISDNINPDILNYEVLYIGQAYGKNGKRTAIKRLFKHETLQKIYTHSLTQNPESDIWIMLTSFSQADMLLSIGKNHINHIRNSYKRDKNLVEHFFNNKGFKISENQKINFTEAALIKYFEPTYNLDFKKNFPDKKHKSYSECYKLDIRALNIELDTSEHIRNLYSKKAGNKNNHSAMFNFENDSDRISFLDMYE
ncbi:hypothetical protein [Flavobacterium notoginsengisoli]|uniref:hypothetical protein n=1 Tax=Flavobacterium notoginsengisoli TaxID=1478199 RepID=UPI00363EED34